MIRCSVNRNSRVGRFTSALKSGSKLLLLAVVIVPVLHGDAFAQRTLDRIQRGWDDIRPRGKLLREIFGENENDNARQQQMNLERQRQLNQQQGNRGGQPTLAGQGQRDNSQQRQPQQFQNRDGNNRQPQFQAGQQNRNPQFNGQRPVANKQGNSGTKHPQSLEILTAPARGVEGLVVQKIAENGAAYAAGIRRGDLINSVGGIAIESNQDLESITEVLKNGDQIEFEVTRQGKKAKVLVQFGEPPVEDEDEGKNPAPKAPPRGAAAGRISDLVAQAPKNTMPVKQAGHTQSPLRSVLDRELSIAYSHQLRGEVLATTNQMRSNQVPAFSLGSAGDRQADRRSTSQVNPPAMQPSLFNANRNNWQVAPPQRQAARPQQAGNSQYNQQQPGLRPAPSQMTNELKLRRDLEQKQLEIERLRQQLDRQSNVPSNSDDSLLDFNNKR